MSWLDRARIYIRWSDDARSVTDDEYQEIRKYTAGQILRELVKEIER